MTPRRYWIVALGVVGTAAAWRACDVRTPRGQAAESRLAAEPTKPREETREQVGERVEARPSVRPRIRTTFSIGSFRFTEFVRDEESLHSGGIVVGTVLDDSGDALAGARIAGSGVKVGEDLRIDAWTESDSSGRFRAPIGSFLLVAPPEDRPELLSHTVRIPWPVEQFLGVMQYDEVEVGTLRLERGHELGGHVALRSAELDETRPVRVEAGLPSLPIRAWRSPATELYRWNGKELRRSYHRVECEGDRFELVGLHAAEYRLRIDPGCYGLDPEAPLLDLVAFHAALEVAAPARDVVLPLNYAPTAVSVSSEDAPVPYAHSRLSFSFGNGGAGGSVRSDAQGRLTVLLPQDRPLELTATHAGYFPDAATVHNRELAWGRASLELTADPSPVPDPWPSGLTGEALIQSQRLPARDGADDALGLWVLEYDGQAFDAGIETALEQLAADGPGFHWRADAPAVHSVVCRPLGDGGARLYGLPAGPYVVVPAALTRSAGSGWSLVRVGARIRFDVQPNQTAVVR